MVLRRRSIVKFTFRASYIALSAVLSFSLLANGQSSASDNLLFIDSIHATGTRSLDSAQLNEILGPLNHMKVHSTDEIKDRLRFLFQDYGYFDAEVKSVTLKVLDPLAKPTAVDAEAEVAEGRRFAFGNIQFTGMHALSADELRARYPVHPGDWFSRTAVGSGLEAMRDAYVEKGYLDLYAIPDVIKEGDGKIGLRIEVHEGDQYGMGKLQFAGNAENAEQLKARWQLEPGKPFDFGYFKKFLKDNESLLSPQFEMERSTKIARDCQDHTVAVYIELSPDHPNVTPPNDIGCDEKSNSPVK